MVKQIVREVFFLGQPSTPATKADIQVGKDLQDTLQENREHCVGMAANMIGVKKNIMISTGKNSVRNYLDGQHKSVSMKLIICSVGFFTELLCKDTTYLSKSQVI